MTHITQVIYNTMKLKEYFFRYPQDKKEFAEKLGITRNTLYRYISGKYKPTKTTKVAIEYITSGEVLKNDW